MKVRGVSLAKESKRWQTLIVIITIFQAINKMVVLKFYFLFDSDISCLKLNNMFECSGM